MSYSAPVPAYRYNGTLVSAEAFYAVACDPRRSVAVEACAGAGKTWMLVSRIVRALLDGVDAHSGQLRVQPHEILAITFTKRAASEMRERLYQWLADFAASDHETLVKELRDRGVLTKNDIQSSSSLPEQLSKLYQGILASGRQVQVRTFHSWFATLLRSAPLAVLQQMELPADYELLEDDAPAKALVWRRFYAALLADADGKVDFDAVVFDYGRAQTEKALQTAIDKRTEFALADAQGVVAQSVRHFCDQYPEFAGLAAPDDFLRADPQRWQTLLDAAKALGRAGAKTFSAKGVELEIALAAGDLSSAFGALLTKDGAPRKFSEKLVGVPKVRAAQDLALRVVAARLQHAAWVYQQRMVRLTRLLLKEFAALKREHGWVDMNDVERAALVMLGDPVLSGWVQERLDARIKHLLIDEFQDTNPLQWQALKSWLSGYAGAGGAAPSVFIVGDPKQSIYRFRRAEPQVFKAAKEFIRDGLKGDLLSCDHTRRNATAVIATVNAAMIDAAQCDGYDGFRAHTSSSSEAGWVCKLPPIPRPGSQTSAARDNDGTDDDTDSLDGSRETDWRDSLTTPRELPEETLRTMEARQAAAWIAEQLANTMAPSHSGLPHYAFHEPVVIANEVKQSMSPEGMDRHAALAMTVQGPCAVSGLIRAARNDESGLQAADVMVLARKRAALLPMQDELRRLHIAAQIGEKTDLIECCEVQDVVALLDVLVSPQHELSLARALKSPLFGMNDEALVELALKRGESNQAWFDLLNETELQTQDERSVGACLTRWKSWLDRLPPHDALQAIYTDGDVLARFAAVAPITQRDVVLANLRALLGVSLQLGGGRFATPYAFVRALKAGGVLAPAALNPHAVRLLTIHGAKGLEAKTVLLLDTDSPDRNAETMVVLVDWPGAAARPKKFVFLASESQPPACAVVTLDTERVERRREELNALYVALTRARNTLAISSIEPHRQAGRSWWQRLTNLAAGVTVGQNPAQKPASQASAAASVFYIKELPLGGFEKAQSVTNNGATNQSTNAAQESDGKVPDSVREQADSVIARIGRAMHRLLEWGDPSDQNTAAVAREFDLTPAQGGQAAAMAERILRGAGAWAWDPAVLGWQGNEVELTVSGETLRLDRLVQRKDGDHAGQWWVLDFKSTQSPQDQPELVAQLSRYRAAVQSIYPDAVVRAAFLTSDGAVVQKFT